ncbi:hypothetical protein AVEN_67189-1 [Araneus ventricosus]|uniref:Uncharacterized protein n=1 Tax=Araneus ventricosus TaxID=182803 RepID=A0A4Y2TJS1_ARAVE|nr:hypothetical protein AVEN_67189-1 [Araneus ventricosus]
MNFPQRQIHLQPPPPKPETFVTNTIFSHHHNKTLQSATEPTERNSNQGYAFIKHHSLPQQSTKDFFLNTLVKTSRNESNCNAKEDLMPPIMTIHPRFRVHVKSQTSGKIDQKPYCLHLTQTKSISKLQLTPKVKDNLNPTQELSQQNHPTSTSIKTICYSQH